MSRTISRSNFLRFSILSATMLVASSRAWSEEDEITREMLFGDPNVPVGGNPNGDVTILDFFDYNCPYCKMAAKSLEKVVSDDGNIRIIYRDWPILTDTSIVGARLALGAKYQSKYLSAHHALMKIPGYGIAEEKMTTAVRSSGVDMARLDADMKTYSGEIVKLLKRNLDIADAIGFQGTPGFLIGPFKVNGVLNEEGFKQAIAEARAEQKKSPR